MEFKDQVTFSAGNGSNAVAIGDFNEDNNLDLVVANSSDNNVSVLLGNGSGSFGAQITFAVGNSPDSVAIGDFNRDNNLDLAVANLTNNNVSVLLGDGNGSFGEQTTFATGTGTGNLTYSVAIGDFNRDNNLDLAVANLTNNNVCVLLGDGNGSFGTQTTFVVGSSPRALAIGDFNGDSNPDLAVANRSDQNVSILLGDSNGSFGEQITFATGNGPNAIAIGDFNKDSNLDLAAASGTSSSVSVLLGNGSGSFSEQTTFASGSAQSVAIGDLDGDGNLDLVTASHFRGSGSIVSVLPGDGNGGFGLSHIFTAGNAPNSVAIGDLDGDGSADDLAVANQYSDNVSVLIECFLTGTRILTDKGEITVENLQIGDDIVTAEGKLEPVKWIGYQTIAPHQVKNPLRGYPILIKAGALGNNLPQRDLYVSPDHAMFFEGLLINAGALVNGTSIVKTEPQEAFTYYHVELPNHALLLAEGASAESYLPQNEDRWAYENGAEYEKLYPNGSNLMLWPMDYPRISSWNKVPRYMRKKLNLIAEELALLIKAA